MGFAYQKLLQSLSLRLTPSHSFSWLSSHNGLRLDFIERFFHVYYIHISKMAKYVVKYSDPDHSLGEVGIAGTFSEWKVVPMVYSEDSESWNYSVNVEAKSKLVYKFVVEGCNWCCDYSKDVETDASGNENNYAEVDPEHLEESHAEPVDSSVSSIPESETRDSDSAQELAPSSSRDPARQHPVKKREIPSYGRLVQLWHVILRWFAFLLNRADH